MALHAVAVVANIKPGIEGNRTIVSIIIIVPTEIFHICFYEQREDMYYVRTHLEIY